MSEARATRLLATICLLSAVLAIIVAAASQATELLTLAIMVAIYCAIVLHLNRPNRKARK